MSGQSVWDQTCILYTTCETHNIVQVFCERKLKISWFDFEKIKVELYANQDESVSDLQMPSCVMIFIVFALWITNEFYDISENGYRHWNCYQSYYVVFCFQHACGYEYTNRLHRMFTDMSISSDLNSSFNDFLSHSNVDLGVNFSLLVLQVSGIIWIINYMHHVFHIMDCSSYQGIAYSIPVSTHLCMIVWLIHSYVFVYLLVSLFACLFVCLFICLFICTCPNYFLHMLMNEWMNEWINPLIHLFVPAFAHLLMHSFIHTIYLSVHASIYPYFHLFAHSLILSFADLLILSCFCCYSLVHGLLVRHRYLPLLYLRSWLNLFKW